MSDNAPADYFSKNFFDNWRKKGWTPDQAKEQAANFGLNYDHSTGQLGLPQQDPNAEHNQAWNAWFHGDATGKPAAPAVNVQPLVNRLSGTSNFSAKDSPEARDSHWNSFFGDKGNAGTLAAQSANTLGAWNANAKDLADKRAFRAANGIAPPSTLDWNIQSDRNARVPMQDSGVGSIIGGPTAADMLGRQSFIDAITGRMTTQILPTAGDRRSAISFASDARKFPPAGPSGIYEESGKRWNDPIEAAMAVLTKKKRTGYL